MTALPLSNSDFASFSPVEFRLPAGPVIRGLQSEQRGRPLIVFLHGNGFSGGVYRPMLEQLTPSFDLLLLDIPGHGASDALTPYPDWHSAAELMHSATQEFIARHPLHQSRPVIGMGHSLGSILTLFAARRHPQTYRTLLLLDPILFPRAMLATLLFCHRIGITDWFHPHVKSTRRRRNGWSSVAAAEDYFRGRKIFANWPEASLQAYVSHALQQHADGSLTLCCDPGLEAHFFATPPAGQWDAVDHLPCPASIIMGQNTYPFALRAVRTAAAADQRIDLSIMPGGHCFMQENPAASASLILQRLANYQDG